MIKIILFFLALNFTVYAQSNEAPETVIKEIFARAQKENVLLNPKAKAELDAKFDFRQMSLNILGAEAKKRQPADLAWFEQSIKDIITKTVYPKAPEFLRNVKISYKNPQIDGEKASIPSTVSKKGETTDVKYVLTKVEGHWKVIDVSIDDESWVKTINEKMQKSLNEKGWPGVKDLLNKRLKELNKKK